MKLSENQTYYNHIVNITDDANWNSINFLESLKYRQNVITLLEFLTNLKQVKDIEFTLKPSFKSKILEENDLVDITDDKETEMGIFYVKFEGNSDALLKEINELDIIIPFNIEYNEELELMEFIYDEERLEDQAQ